MVLQLRMGRCDRPADRGAVTVRTASWIAALAVAAAAFVYGAVDEGPPQTNADRAHALAEDFACPVCSGQSVAESDVPVAREIRRQIAVWVDEGRSDGYIRDRLVAAYDADIDYNPSASGVTSLVWILPLVAGAGIAAVVVSMLRSGRRPAPASAEPSPAGGRRRWRNAAAWTVAVVAVAGAAGVLVARSSGSRGADGSITGEIRTTTRELIFEAQTRLGQNDIDGAIAVYDEALDLQPSNAEALTYRGWLTSRTGDTATAVRFLDDAIGVEPDYPDARLFRAIVALDEGDAVRAAEEMAAFDALDPPPYAEALIEQAQVRQRVAAARNTAALDAVEAVYASDDRPTFAATGLTVSGAVAAAEAMAGQGRLLDALQLLDWVGASHPDDGLLAAERGWLLVRAGDPELLALSIQYFDEALSVEPDNPRALVYRAFALFGSGETAAARADLASFDALQDRPSDIVRLIEEQGLREALSR